MSDAFFTLHRGLPREGPGDRESLDWALGLAGVRPDARILDAGCGPGADIEGLLAHAPAGHVTAIDAHSGFIVQIKTRWGDDRRVTAHAGDMARPGGPYDLIWCAGALYFLGITEGLRAWHAVLAPGGSVAFSELVWLTGTRDPVIEAAWSAEYPAIAGIETLKTRIATAGYETLGVHILSDAAWEAYFKPIEERAAGLFPGADADLAAVLDEAEAEIAMWRTHRREVGYALAVVRPR